VTVAGVSPASQDRLQTVDRLGERRVPVAEVERLRRRERHVDAVQPGGGEAFPAAFVEHQAREFHAVVPADALDHVLRAGHLRHALGADEADGLDSRHAGRCKPVDQLRPRLGREHLRLVLETVARSDVANDDVHHRRA